MGNRNEMMVVMHKTLGVIRSTDLTVIGVPLHFFKVWNVDWRVTLIALLFDCSVKVLATCPSSKAKTPQTSSLKYSLTETNVIKS